MFQRQGGGNEPQKEQKCEQCVCWQNIGHATKAHYGVCRGVLVRFTGNKLACNDWRNNHADQQHGNNSAGFTRDNRPHSTPFSRREE